VSILALSGGQKLGILAVAAVFIGFALASSFLLSRRNPDFPGPRGVVFFSVLSVALFVAMLTAMFAFAREEHESAGHEAAPGQTQAGETQPGETQPGGTQPVETLPTETGAGGAAEGDPEAGKEVFASAGCTACHTLADAGATGTVGPNLDQAKPSYELAVDRVTNGAGAMPSFAEQLSEEQIRDVAAYVVEATSGS
jgi:cytochrome c6